MHCLLCGSIVCVFMCVCVRECERACLRICLDEGKGK